MAGCCAGRRHRMAGRQGRYQGGGIARHQRGYGKRAAFQPVMDRADKPGAYNPYTDEQKALLAKIVFGDRG